jgi:GNAT superfamily N-acetyltransferase
MEIRPAREDEIEELTRLFIRARNEMDYLPSVPDEAAEPIAARIRENDEVWVAEEDARLLGFLAIEHSTNLDAPVLEKLHVEPTEQNRGVGSALLEKAKELRPDELYLWVFQKNPARRLYERQGFELVKLTDGAENMEREPDALYRWVNPTRGRAAGGRGSSAR